MCFHFSRFYGGHDFSYREATQTSEGNECTWIRGVVPSTEDKTSLMLVSAYMFWLTRHGEMSVLENFISKLQRETTKLESEENMPSHYYVNTMTS